MEKREYTVVIERDEEGYFVADVPELPGCHTQAKSLDTLMNRVEEAIALGLDVDLRGSGLARRQSPPPGSRLTAGARVTVEFER